MYGDLIPYLFYVPRDDVVAVADMSSHAREACIKMLRFLLIRAQDRNEDTSLGGGEVYGVLIGDRVVQISQSKC